MMVMSQQQKACQNQTDLIMSHVPQSQKENGFMIGTCAVNTKPWNIIRLSR